MFINILKPLGLALLMIVTVFVILTLNVIALPFIWTKCEKGINAIKKIVSLYCDSMGPVEEWCRDF